MAKQILVTGAAGFIGFHLARQLLWRGDRVVGVDNFNDYYSPQLKRDRAAILEQEGLLLVESDINDNQTLDQLIEANRITHLVHLAAQAGVRHSLTNPAAYINTNISGFLAILEACRRHPGIKLTYASSSSVYGLNQKQPFALQDRTDSQASLYGVTKKSNELMASAYHHLYGIAATGLRFFTVYGPWGRPDMAYFSFTDAIANNRPIQLFNNGKLMRDFTHIDDIIAGTLAAIDLGAPHQLFNLGNSQPVELIHFVKMIEEALGKEADKQYLPMQPGDVASTYADISQSRQMLGFSPKVSLKEGIHSFVSWYKEYFER
jgi:UDP-glucuronate 4-epimerase